ncbi:MAG: SMP-30/gluconolactonase/LRE family protein [Bacteroidota bacterium]
MKRVLKAIGLFLLLSILYLLFWPINVNPQLWNAPPNPGYSGVFEQNTQLQAVQIRHKACLACEDVAVDSLGRVYGAAVDGRILRFTDGQDEPEVLANTNGRPLGLDFDAVGNLYIADAIKGLLRLNSAHELSVMSIETDGRPFKFTDDVEVGPDGKVYFSDASDYWGIHDYKLDLLEHRPLGRLLVFDPASGSTTTLLDSVYFANGIAVAADTSFVLVNETSNYRTVRYYLKGPKTGQTDIFIENLPAFPDGISRGSNGIFWLAMISPRNPLIDRFSTSPFMRKVIARLPTWLQPAPATHAGVLGIASDGTVRYNFQDPEGKFSQISSVQEWNGHLYLGSLLREGVGVLENFRAIGE